MTVDAFINGLLYFVTAWKECWERNSEEQYIVIESDNEVWYDVKLFNLIIFLLRRRK